MKIGVLGGTFDPIHSGHLDIARKTARIFSLDRVLFMVARKPPHKERAITSRYHRYAMTVLALQQEPSFFASGLELQRSGPSYTFETLGLLESKFPAAQIGFIAGSDSLKEIHLWKNYGTLFTKYSLIFFQRPGSRVDFGELSLDPHLKELIRSIEDKERPHLTPGVSFLLDVSPPQVSSTEIRNLLAAGRPPSTDKLCSSVLHYVKKYGVYGKNETGD